MLNKIRQLLTEKVEAGAIENDQMVTRKVQTAAAALLIELIRTDGSGDDSEWRSLHTLLATTFDLDDSDLQDLIANAEESVDESTDLYQYTRMINDHYDYDAKCLLLESMWRVARADGRIDRYEEHLIRKIQGLIYVTHADFIKAKQRSRIRTGIG